MRKGGLGEDIGANYLSAMKHKLQGVLGRWAKASRTKRIALSTLLLLLAFSILELFFLQRIILPFLESILRMAYEGSAPEIINSLFQRVAQDAYKTEIELYLEKLRAAYAWVRVLIILVFTLSIAIVGRRILRGRRSGQNIAELLGTYRILLLGGLILGLTISIRIA